MTKRTQVKVVLVLFIVQVSLLWFMSQASRPNVPVAPTPPLVAPAAADVGPSYQFTGTPADVTYQGIIAYADPSYGPLYLAIPELRGTLATICGPRGCVDRVSTDVGPDLAMQRAGRIADVSSTDFETICGELRFGTCPGSVTIGRRPRVSLPPTDR